MRTVLYVGNFEPSHSTENEVRRAFEHLGWTVDTLQEATFGRDITRGPAAENIYDRAGHADLVLHTLTQGSYPEPERVIALWRALAAKGIPTASIHLDLFYGLASQKDSGPQRQDLPREHPMFRVGYVFTPDGGHDDLWKRDGVNHHWLPPGVSHTECIDVSAWDDSGLYERPDWMSDEMFERLLGGEYLVGFAGSANPDDPRGGYHPEHGHRDALVRWLRDEYGDKFLHIGGSSTPRVTHLALNRIFASVPVWVGDSCLTRPDFPYWSDRVPETWGRGGFLIHPQVHALDEHYAGHVIHDGPYHYVQKDVHHPGHSWECGDWNTLRGLIAMWLDDAERRESVRGIFASRTRAYDTYVNRVQTILDTIGIA